MIAVILTALLPACSATTGISRASSVFSGWSATDLRFLQAPGEDEQHAIIAVYQRTVVSDLEIRLDFLDLTDPVDFDLYLALDTQPGGSHQLPIAATTGLAYDLLIKVPAQGQPAAYDAKQKEFTGLIPRSASSPTLDLMTIQLNRDQLPGNPNQMGMQAFLTLNGKTAIVSQTAAIEPASPPPALAPLYFVFWDALPAATPVQTLRRWDGAHTGPLGGRHGLNVLLQAAGEQHIPILLADLKQPASLTGLGFVNGLEPVRKAALRGDVILADPATGDPRLAGESLTQNLEAGLRDGLPASLLAFGAFSPPFPSGHNLYLADLPDPHHIVGYQNERLLPLPQPIYPQTNQSSEPQATLDGLSLTLRKQLLSVALSPDPGDLIALGGSLPQSTWGEFSIAPAAFAYIAVHPWMKPMGLADLQNLPAKPAQDWPLPADCQDLLCAPSTPDWVPRLLDGQAAPSGITLALLQNRLRTDLLALPDGPLASLAWQSYLNLTRPTADPRLAGLQANALGMVGILNEAARWADQPYIRTDCQSDLDLDGLPECILSDVHWMAVLKTDGGRLVFAAHRDEQGVTQWVGPSSQFVVGLGDPSEWKPEAGLAGDPGQIPGAFAPQTLPFANEVAEIQPARIVLRSPDGNAVKAFAISGVNLTVDLTFSQPTSVQLPLTLAPQSWAAGDAAYPQLPAPVATADTWSWQPHNESGLQVQVQNAEIISSISSLDSSSLMSAQENPNLAYPAGHYLPYPLARLELNGREIHIQFIP